MLRSCVGVALVGACVTMLSACGDSTRPGTGGVIDEDCSTGAVALGSLQGAIFPAAQVASCLALPADGGTYVVVPNFPTETAPARPVSFVVSTELKQAGTASLATGNLVRDYSAQGLTLAHRPVGQGFGPAATFETMLRAKERRLARMAPASRTAISAERARAVAGAPPPAVGSTHEFQVCVNSSCSQFKNDTAILKFAGNKILIYQGQHALAPPSGFTDSQIQALGTLFETDLYDIDVATFGAPSDIDANGRVIVLMSPYINSITPTNAQGNCPNGFVAGFFFGLDLISGQPHSNEGEIFYADVPDPNGQFSCPHSVDLIERITPSTFIHEFQHMISFNQHVLVNSGPSEENWLNEGLSHIAEELGSRFYEHKFPPPAGRTDPQQLFPDSSQGFINGDLFNSAIYLSNTTALGSDSASVSDWGGDGTLVQRGAAWLFLRWLGDLQDSAVYGRLDQTGLTGVDNVEGATGEDFTALFGQFALALYTDSLPGVARSAIPPELRFESRNLRQLYARLNTTDPQDFPNEFPIQLKPLPVPGSVQNQMYPGTMDFYLLQLPTSPGDSVKLRFQGTPTATFNDLLHAQVSVFRCPSADVCQ